MMQVNNNTIINIIEVVKKANNAILEVYNSTNFAVEYKKDNSPLTIADKRSHDIICDGLKKLYPDVLIISEEGEQLDYQIRKNHKQCFLVDPLDGTREFLKRNGEFTINIALIEDSEPILGIMSIPIKNLIYYGYKNNGSYSLNLNTGNEKKLYCIPFHKNDPIVIILSRSHDNEETMRFCDNFNVNRIERAGSASKFMCLAENSSNVYPRLGNTMEWDVCAADIILREAGGRIEQLDGSPLKYNKPSLLNPHFIAYGNMI